MTFARVIAFAILYPLVLIVVSFALLFHLPRGGAAVQGDFLSSIAIPAWWWLLLIVPPVLLVVAWAWRRGGGRATP